MLVAEEKKQKVAIATKRRDAEPALRRAIETADNYYLKYLFDKDADEKSWRHALKLAAEYGHIEVVKLLLSAVDAEGKDTALLYAAREGRIEVFKLLLSDGANKDVTHSGNETLLHLAVGSGNLELTKMLLDLGADKDAKRTDNGFTPLITAAFTSRNGSHVEIARLLIAAGADTHATTTHGTTALNCIGSAYMDPKILEVLLGDPKMVATNLLIEALEATDIGGAEENLRLLDKPFLNRALCMACASKKIKGQSVSWLIQKGADVNARGPNQRTPLHEAIACGSEESGDWDQTEAGKDGPPEKVRLLLAHGADLTAEEDHGLTPMAMARYLGKRTAVALLAGTTVKAAWEQAHPIETSYEAMSRQLVHDHGPLERVEYISHWPKFEIRFHYKDGACVYSGSRTAKHDINFLSLGYVGEGPRYAKHFLEAAGFNLTTDEIANIKVGDKVVLRSGKAVVNRDPSPPGDPMQRPLHAPD